MKKDSRVENLIPSDSELSELDTGAFRRMRLDPSQSYGMSVKRPTGEMSGNYAILSAPSHVCEEDGKQAVPLCDTCGAKIEDLRLSCTSCGNYLHSGVRQSSWDKLRTESRTRSVLAIETPAQITCRELMLKRLTAATIDCALVGIVLLIAGFLYFRYVLSTIGADPHLEPLLVSISYGVLPVATLVSYALYNASFESSPVMATLGNMVVGLTVSRVSGEALTFTDSIGRSAVNLSPVAMLTVSVWLTKLLNPTLESFSWDILLYTTEAIWLVVIFCLLVYSVNLFWISFSGKNQSLCDFVTDTVVSSK